MLVYIFGVRDFQIKEFKDTIEVPFNSTFKKDAGNVCFGNKFKCLSVTVSDEGYVNTSKIGEYKISYIYKYKKKTLTKKQIVKVKDFDAPLITLEEGTDFNVCPNAKEVNFKVIATDNYDGDISSQVEQTLNNNQVIFTVKDSSGNKAELTKEITFSDTIDPTITLKGDAVTYVTLNSTYTDKGATATDNCDGDITNRITATGSVDTSKVGDYKITYTVKDSANHSKSIERKVTVYEKSNIVETVPNGRTIYLTFDDGPSSYTAKLLDVLKKYNVKATFFVTNQAITKGHDDLILRAYNEGHTIGLHTYTHNYNIYTNVDTYFNDLYAIQEKVKNITGYTSTIIRFPGGSSNTISRSHDGGTKIMSTLTKAVEAKGFRYWDWNVSSGDAGETKSTTQVFKNVTKALGNGKTYVVLQHDIKGFSVDAVEDIINYALAKGYSFKALTMDSPTVHHGINN